MALKGGVFLALVDVKYKRNQTILKVYGCGDSKKIKVVTMRSLRTAGIECEEIRAPRCTANDVKLEENVRRAKNKIFEYAFCNPWDWFFTGTIDGSKYDRTDLKRYKSDLTQWFRNYGRQHGFNIRFLLVPELHSDGVSWHVHGFLLGVPVSVLRKFQIGDRMGKAIAAKVRNGEDVYTWPAYAEKFGFCDLEPIRNHEAVSKYVTKYINKDLASSVTELNAQLYMCSRGLSVAQEIKRGVMSGGTNITPDYENDYCSVSWLDYSSELLARLEDSIDSADYYSMRFRG